MIVGLMLFTLNRYTSKSITDLTDINDSKQELSIRTEQVGRIVESMATTFGFYGGME
jgi:uncharacterized protein with GYD domain